MKLSKLVPMVVVITAVLMSGAAAEAGREAGNRGSLKKLGFKFYWSLLDADQQMQAKEIIADHLAGTAADRAAAAARVARYRADLVGLLTHVQIRKAARIKRVMKALPRQKRLAVFDRLLDKTDRAGFTDRVSRIVDAGPEDRVRIGFELLDQVVDMYLSAYGPRIDLTREQETRIRELYAELKADLTPIALRLSTARAQVIVDAKAILTDEQREKVGKFKDTVLEKVLAWLRG